MDNPNAVAYFRGLADIASSMEVTDADGAGVSIDDGVDRALQMLLAARSAGSKVMLIANGGSAAIVSHMQNDLCKAVGVRALVFYDAPLLTALTNDEGYIHAFERCVNLWAEPKDIVLAISSSGSSENILLGVKAARAHGVSVISMSGFAPDNPLRKMGDLNFYVPSNTYGPVELSHQALTHFLTDCAKSIHD